MFKNQKVAAIIVAAGESRRMEGVDKIFAPIKGEPVLSWVLGSFQKSKYIDRIVLVVSPQNMENARRLMALGHWTKITDVCPGGRRRQDSVGEGLKRLTSSACDWILVHDGARPIVTGDLIERGLEAAQATGAAIPVLPVNETIKWVGPDGMVRQTIPRQNLRTVQTPQVFRTVIIKNAYEHTFTEVTDDSALVEKAGYKIKAFEGSYDNIKITTPDDLATAEILLNKYEL